MSAPVDPTALLAEAERAAVRRAHQTNPDVVALHVEQARDLIERVMWVGIAIGLVFTTVSVQQWGAGSAPLWSLVWCSMWLLGPLVELPLLAILRAEQVAGRYGVPPGGWMRTARWVLLGFAYAMNTGGPWSALLTDDGPWRDVWLHSVPPLAVLIAAEAVTDLREVLGRAIERAAARPVARPVAPRPPARKPSPTPLSEIPPADDQAPPLPPPPGPPADPPARGAQEVAVAWALAHWDDPDGARGPLRPLHVRDHMKAIGQEIHKSTATKVMNAARAERERLGLPIGLRPVSDNTDTPDDREEEAG